MASLFRFNTGWRVCYYVKAGDKSSYKTFFGEDSYEKGLKFKREMDKSYPDRRKIIHKERPVLPNKRTGVSYSLNKRVYKGVEYTYPSWTASINRNPDGTHRWSHHIRFYLSRETRKGGAYEDACLCRSIYEECVRDGTMAIFWIKYPRIK